MEQSDNRILIGTKPKERYESFMGPAVLIDYWPYIMNGQIKDLDNARRVALELGCQLPQQKINNYFS